jgi:DNA replication and repair protein RecF
LQLTRLRARRLRNFEEVDLELPPGLTLLSGGNGQGKTTLLEAAYLLCTGRSFRTRKVEDLVSWSGGPLSVHGRVSARQGESELGVTWDAGERSLLANGAKVGLESFLGRLTAIDLTLQRMDVLRGPPDERRRFLDRGVLGLDTTYLRVIGEYRRVLRHRNALLRREAVLGAGSTELDAWDQRLAASATALHLERRHYAERLGSELVKIGRELLPDGKVPLLCYLPSPSELDETADDAVEQLIGERLERCRGRDRELGHTSEGPHRDDLRVELDGADLRRFGSAGQVRAAMIALKLGKLSLLGEASGEAPLFLLDDFDTDLDDARMAALIGYLEGVGCQVLLATSKEGTSGRIGWVELLLRVENGVARPA